PSRPSIPPTSPGPLPHVAPPQETYPPLSLQFVHVPSAANQSLPPNQPLSSNHPLSNTQHFSAQGPLAQAPQQPQSRPVSSHLPSSPSRPPFVHVSSSSHHVSASQQALSPHHTLPSSSPQHAPLSQHTTSDLLTMRSHSTSYGAANNGPGPLVSSQDVML